MGQTAWDKVLGKRELEKIKSQCPECYHGNAWKKKGMLKCSKCGHKYSKKK